MKRVSSLADRMGGICPSLLLYQQETSPGRTHTCAKHKSRY